MSKMKEIFLPLCLLLVVREISSLPLENMSYMRNKRSAEDDSSVEDDIEESLESLDTLEDMKDEDFAKDILTGGKNMLEFVQNMQTHAKETYEKQIKETQETLKSIMQGIETLDEKHKTIAAEAVTEVLKVKTILRVTRTELNELAERIIDAMDEFKATALTVFNGEVTTKEDIEDILSFDYETMKTLIGEGQLLIDKAQEAYADVGASLTKIEDNLTKYEQFVNAIVNDEKRAVDFHESSVMISRATIYSSCATSTTVCIFVDIFMTFGACSAINAGTCGGIIASMESTIAAVKANLQALEGRAEQAHSLVNDLLDDQKKLMTYFVEEKDYLARLDSRLTSANSNLKRSKVLFFKNIPTLRKRYIQSLDNLKKAAQDYLSQPELDF